jgi:hypothetical protein
MSRAILCAFILTGLLIFGICHTAFSGCPDCFFDMEPMDGPGSPAGRRTISVKIDASWGTTTNARIWNATCSGTGTAGCPAGTSALSMWNNQRDSSGNYTGYYLDLQQNNSNPQITITQADPGAGNCSGVNPDGPPYVIRLPASILNFSDAEIMGRIAHEIGHPLGAANDENCPSIMNTSSADCHRTSNEVNLRT